MTAKDIIAALPYQHPFLFVDELTEINENGVTGCYRFLNSHDFYKGHFKNNPVTPGVILTETMAQIGLVCYGIYLLHTMGQPMDNVKLALTSSEMNFFIPVFPNEKVVVKSKKEYFRFHKLKCTVEMFNEKGALVCRGTISGMIKSRDE